MGVVAKQFSKMNKDLSKTKYPDDIYYEGLNIRVSTNSNSGSVSNIKDVFTKITFSSISSNPTTKTYLTPGNPPYYTLSYPYTASQILGNIEFGDYLYSFVNYGDGPLGGDDRFLAIYKTSSNNASNPTYTSTLIFFDFLDIQTTKQLDIVGFYENDDNIKLYMTDGENPLRFFNVGDPALLNLEAKFVDMLPLQKSISVPELQEYSTGGNHTSGMIQYAYNLYNLNGAQTKISPLSNLIFLNNDETGQEVGEAVNKVPIVSIDNIDDEFDKIKIYSVKYTSLNAIPEVKIIKDVDLNSDTLTFSDDNSNTSISITFEEFLLLGGDRYIAKHLIIKDNRLFIGNYSVTKKDVDFDARAYSFNNANEARIETEAGTPTTINSTTISTYPDDYNVGETHDCINPTVQAEEGTTYYGGSSGSNSYIHPYNDTTKRGGTGPNVSYYLTSNATDINASTPSSIATSNIADRVDAYYQTGLKTGEVYRLFVEFLFNDGSWSFPKWVADVKMPLIGEWLNSSTSAFYTASGNFVRHLAIVTSLDNTPSDDNIIGWRTSIVERKEEDKSVISQGLLSTTITDNVTSVDVLPSYIQRTMSKASTAFLSTESEKYVYPKKMNTNHGGSTYDDYISVNGDNVGTYSDDVLYEGEILADYDGYRRNKSIVTVITPETIFYDKLPTSTGKMRKVGYLKQTGIRTNREVKDLDEDVVVSDLQSPYSGVYFPPIGNNLNTSDKIGSGTGMTWSVSAEEEAESRISKLISDVSDKASVSDPANYSYSTQKYLFTRYFGGFTTFATDRINNSIDGKCAILRPSSGIINVPDGASSTTSITSSPSIQIKYDSTVYNYFNYKVGTCIVVNNVDADYTEYTTSEASAVSSTEHNGVIVEFYKVLSNQYGGNTYTARQNNKVIPYSGVMPISTTTSSKHVGDTFVQRFNALRTTKADVASDTQIAEIVSFPVETDINLDLRYDLLKYTQNNFDSEESTSYGFNKVYNQKNNTIYNVTKPSSFVETTKFPFTIMSSKVKIAGETIDNFTDFLVNETITVDGSFGEITSLNLFKDNLYSFQRKAVSYIPINPRTQVLGADGISIELGSGDLFQNYNYITTQSGSISKHSIVESKEGLMYADLLNKSINFIGGELGYVKMSTLTGLHDDIKTRFTDVYVGLSEDTFFKRIIAIYDSINEEVLFTIYNFPAETSNITICYDTLMQGFTSYYQFSTTPNQLFTFQNKVFSSELASNKIQQHNIGDYLKCQLSFIVGNEPINNKILNNIHFNSQALDYSTIGSDLPKVTFNSLQVHNEYQSTNGTIVPSHFPSSNIDPEAYIGSGKRRLRKWNYIVPREYNTRNRMQAPWHIVTLSFDKSNLSATYNTKNIKLILNDLIVSYTNL